VPAPRRQSRLCTTSGRSRALRAPDSAGMRSYEANRVATGCGFLLPDTLT
jgi:hypothetical protein